LPPEQAGVGSAVNDTVQELGGSLGVAVIGSVVSASFRHAIDASGLPGGLVRAARPSIAAADATAGHAAGMAGRVIEVAHESFTTAMTGGFAVAGGIALAGAVLTAIFLPRRRTAIEVDRIGIPELVPA
jgi:hypothetical protein